MSSTKEFVDVLPFGIEADHPTNADLLIQVIAGCRLRSAIKPTKEILETIDGVTERRPVHAKMIEGLPRSIPGMQLHVKPETCEYLVTDPIASNERMLVQIKRAVDQNSGMVVADKLRGMPDKEGKLSKDQMKTLVREMVNLVKAGEAKKAKGVIPKMVDVDDLPGDYLLNASNMNNWRQPKHEKDVDAWAEKQDRLN